MSFPKTTQIYILNEPPIGEISSETFKLETRPLPSLEELTDGQILIKVLALSNDPAQRGWMSGKSDPRRAYIPPVKKGEPVRAIVLAEVVASKSTKYKEGTKITCMAGWFEYGVIHESVVSGEAATIPGYSEYISLGLLGGTGMTAYVGAFVELNLNKDSIVVISGAAGGVGSVLVQIAKKVIGCKRVVGIAGGEEKCEWVKSLGADACVDYKDPDYASHLAQELPDFADAYFDNVGGEVLDNMLKLVKRFGKISACGAISGYNGKPLLLQNYGEIITNRLDLKGFVVIDHAGVMPKARQEMIGWLKEGKIDITEGETVVETKFEDVPKTWKMLFEGGNKGKLVTKLVA